MRVAFVSRGLENLGVELMQAICLEAGHETRAFVDPGADTVLQSYNRFTRWINGREFLIDRVVEYRPDLLCVSAYSLTWPYLSEFVDDVRKRIDVPVFAGGVASLATPERLFENPNVDMVCVGEGEDVMAEVCRRLHEGRDFANIDGLWTRQNGRIVPAKGRSRLADLDSLPYPYKDDYFHAGAFHTGLRVMTGRGCPYVCDFCQSAVINKVSKGEAKGSYVRSHSPDYMLGMVDHYVKKFPISHIFFVDSTFNAHRDFLEGFLPMYRERIALPYYCMLFAYQLDKELCRLLGSSGAKRAVVGMECGDEDFRVNVYKKPVYDKKLVEVVGDLRANGVKVLLTLIFGAPGETREHFAKTIRMIDQVRPANILSFTFFPQPGLELTDNAIRDGLIVPEDLENSRVYHDQYVVSHPYAAHVQSANAFVAFYFLAPRLFKPLIFRMCMSGRFTRLQRLVMTITFPAANPAFGWFEYRTAFRSILTGLWRRLEATFRRGGPGVGPKTVQVAESEAG